MYVYVYINHVYVYMCDVINYKYTFGHITHTSTLQRLFAFSVHSFYRLFFNYKETIYVYVSLYPSFRSHAIDTDWLKKPNHGCPGTITADSDRDGDHSV